MILAAGVLTAAQEMPPGASDSNLRNDDVRTRSMELERIKRDANKKDSDTASPAADNIEAKYPEIKEDFEGIQMAQAAIIKAYTTGESIDYGLIESSAKEIKKHSKRLESNLFAVKFEPKEDSDKKEEKTKTVRDLIIELDTAIGDVTVSPMFQNLREIDPEVAHKTQADLFSVSELSDLLAKEAGKMK
jgi:hypothetical protein